VGQDNNGELGGAGGAGISMVDAFGDQVGESGYFGGGGGGGHANSNTGATAAAALGGGGVGGGQDLGAQNDGKASTGGGGGGTGYPLMTQGGEGGSGFVVIICDIAPVVLINECTGPTPPAPRSTF
jgi:hypothetical protein